MRTVKLSDLTPADFPPPSPHVVAEMANAFSSPPCGKEEFNAEIHESPPRLTKNGTFARRRGNKKGFIVGKTKLTQTAGGEKTPEIDEKTGAAEIPAPPPSHEPPPLNIPPAPEAIAVEAEKERLSADMNHHAAEVITATICGVGAAMSGYSADENFRREYSTAFENWFAEMGGVQVKAWVNVALLSGVYAVNLVHARKKESMIEKIKNWCVLKYVNFKNRKRNGGGNSTGTGSPSPQSVGVGTSGTPPQSI